MKRVENLPPAFKRYSKMLGVLDFAVFDDAGGTEQEILTAIPHAIRHAGTFSEAKLRALGCKPIRERAFFGDWYDLESGMLLKVGSYKLADGSELHNPKLKKLDGVKFMSGAAACPEAGVGGQFAYAFSNPPYGLKGKPSEVQSVFDDIRDFILPATQQSAIRDWTSPNLPDVSDYFAPGMEWWGVFLFSVHIPEIQRLTIIAGSTTD
ncbi:hypothetical protein [Sphingomonas xinjiangensis]|uniref:Uncharacterized protein n=1 Tax=Sphingomonas xinjiangensis TaxID=643568 RepID=A0A840YKE6_9SPHN|nr:hypothetical protein [Sphingomonas xinjiangensis]MBB5711618.1 hypothetical protein [Sphingomonas xinjiangensis]